MSDQLNQSQRCKFPRARYQVSHWREYDQALQQRGSLTVWVIPEAIAAGHPTPTGQHGRAHRYSGLAIETGHLLRLVFGRPWRQTEGLLRSITRLLMVSLGISDHITVSRRSVSLSLATERRLTSAPVPVVIGSTGLNVYGAGEWQRKKHGGRDRQTWRKLHLAVNPDSGKILASELTSHEVVDPSMVTLLLDQIPGDMASVLADGAYDGEPVYRAIAERQPSPSPAVIIPPRATAVLSPAAETSPSPRDRPIQTVQEKGRRGWQKPVGYGRPFSCRNRDV